MPSLAILLSRRLPGPSRRPLLSRLLHLAALRRNRSRLAQLDDHLLRDIGLTRDEARAEAERPVWDVPSHWRG